MCNLKYRGFFIDYILEPNLTREGEQGKKEKCKGAVFFVFADEQKMCEIDVFSAAAGFEIPDDSAENIELFAREMVDMQYKEYVRTKEKLSL